MNSDSTKDPERLDESNVVKLLSSIEERLVAAFVAGDPSFHEHVLADDWSTIDITGRVMSKSEVLKEAFAPVEGREITMGQIDQINVRAFEDWAIVTGRTHIKGRQDGENFEIMLRFTDVFAKRNGKWQVVASQGTLFNQ